MSIAWKEIGTRIKPGNWPLLAWAMLVLLLAAIATTVFIGVELSEVVRHPMVFNTR